MPLALRAVRLAAAPSTATPDERPGAALGTLAERHPVEAGDPVSAAGLARALGEHLPLPGSGSTTQLWEALATLAAADLTLARVVEPHLDALAILDQAGVAVEPDRFWGVYAAEGPPPRLRASREGDGWRLTGRKHWCSLAHLADAALVTAWLDDERRGLFSVALDDPGVTPVDGQAWVARGLPQVTSTALDLDHVRATAVGGPAWYLSRPGFAWGGIGVAACWYGGAAGLADAVLQAAAKRSTELAAMHAGAVDVALYAARSALRDAAAGVDAGVADPERLALRARSVVADSVERVLRTAGHALGPAPLAFDPGHAARVADLELYVRQHHGERDLAALGDRAASR